MSMLMQSRTGVFMDAVVAIPLLVRKEGKAT
jgi:hypothetical protein